MEKFNGDLEDLSQFKIINFSDLNKDFTGIKYSFEESKNNKTFEEISNEIALSSPFGKNSRFYREKREIIIGKIPKL